MSWQEELNKGIRTAEQLAEYMGWDQEKLDACRQIAERYPMMITPYYLSLVNKDDPDDPIARMCIPSADEFVPGGSFDTSGEASNTKLEGLQHKYKRTVLLLSTNQCAMYCRHCFRKRLVGLSNEELNKRVDEVVEYVGSHNYTVLGSSIHCLGIEVVVFFLILHQPFVFLDKGEILKGALIHSRVVLACALREVNLGFDDMIERHGVACGFFPCFFR